MTLLHRLISIVRRTVGRNQAERDLNDELQTFVEMAATDQVRDGVTPAEARRQAVLHLGGVEQVKERIRTARSGAWLEQLVQDVRYGARILTKSPGLSLTIVTLVALVIGGNTTVFSIANGIMRNPMPGVRGGCPARC